MTLNERENRIIRTRRLVLTAILTALSIAGRFLFAMLPGFKPVTAFTIICGVFLGPVEGASCGALTALISNFYFGQGPWTPFQMLGLGIIGLFAGILAKILKKRISLLLVYGALCGVFYSLMMDVWTVLWQAEGLTKALYLSAITAAIPFTVMYAVSNVIFLLILRKPLGDRLTRIRIKYGV